jgi:hypothetical protein
MAKQETLWHQGKQVGQLYMSPASRMREPLVDFVASDGTPRHFIDDYTQVIALYNGGFYGPASVNCRRLLEGIMGDLVQEEGKNGLLYERIAMLPQLINTSQPFTDIANALRLVGNFGAHYGQNQTPDKDDAEITIELLEYFMEFIYILPEKIAGINERIMNLKNSRRPNKEESGQNEEV